MTSVTLIAILGISYFIGDFLGGKFFGTSITGLRVAICLGAALCGLLQGLVVSAIISSDVGLLGGALFGLFTSLFCTGAVALIWRKR